LPKTFMTFDNMGLIDPLLKALKEEGYTTPTPIQSQAIPHLLQGRDLLGCAQTGTGKTAAFALPILQKLQATATPAHGRKNIRTLILTPTRELAIQIEESIHAYGRHLSLKSLVVFGGVGQQPQVRALQQGIDILVATPGRLLDLISQGYIGLNHLEVFVLDEADRMLDMGFIHDVKRVITKLPAKRQTLFFSATMPPDIQQLANTILTNPVKVEVTPVSSTAETIQQHIYYVSKNDKRNLLIHLLQKNQDIKSVLVFTRTKHGADRVVKDLMKAGETAAAIHGNKSQNARQLALQNFKKGVIRVLVATDIAARGIDIDDLGYVINYELPNIPESYVHRIGRTGRAGASGIAFSFCEAEERAYLKDIQKLIGTQIPVVHEHPFVNGQHAVSPKEEQRPMQQRRNEPQQNRRQQNNNQPRREQRPSFNKRPAQASGNENNGQQQSQPQPATGNQQQATKRVMVQRPPKPRPPQQQLNAPVSSPLPKKMVQEPQRKPAQSSSSVPVVTPLFSDEDKW
jgi:ATP-dependent RNA helicase RhlE